MRNEFQNPGALAGATGVPKIAKASHAGETEDSKVLARTEVRPKRSRAPFTAQRRWDDKNPTALWAHAATRSAVRRGLIQRGPCAECGSPKTDAHHPDHRNPLDVVWLCRRHHRQLHNAERRPKSKGRE